MITLSERKKSKEKLLHERLNRVNLWDSLVGFIQTQKNR